jgi:phosphoribosylformylglycinamidine synthase PurS subunit
VAVTTGAAQATGQTSRTGRRWLARVQVTLKPVVNDPAGLSIAEALRHLGFGGLDGVRAGKYFEIELRAADRAEAGRRPTRCAGNCWRTRSSRSTRSRWAGRAPVSRGERRDGLPPRDPRVAR